MAMLLISVRTRVVESSNTIEIGTLYIHCIEHLIFMHLAVES